MRLGLGIVLLLSFIISTSELLPPSLPLENLPNQGPFYPFGKGIYLGVTRWAAIFETRKAGNAWSWGGKLFVSPGCCGS